ncbi:Latex clearing protein [Actinosynnema sp. ALI-1.44]|uniref:oxygenase MpaB family protein n=1 Tax=Actinosynnema sp. ALI-1.44 TaxID=1933779 RepID=UPI00097BBEBC|nr:oxygenase MpaB family protein [Actinosynnema sp. ALI-1.44]ONI75192.1 Latex clearing protein [Actinosynnema sp. ALI-1.44]
MEGLSRRNMLLAGGGALGALGALGVTGQAWAWAPSGSVAGSGAGVDPRWVWDEEADPLVASLLERGDVPKVNALLRTWTRNGQPLPDGLPPDVRGFIEQARVLPAWTDWSKLATMMAVTRAKGFWINTLYGVASGLMSPAIPREAIAVYYSKGGAEMKDRIAKTSLLGADITQLDAYKPEGRMIVSSVKTRLVHAAVRHLLPQSPRWAQSGSGQIPISQNEMLVTWHSLPTTVMRKIRAWRIAFPPEHSEAFLHLWQIAGHMLGIKDEYIPATWSEAEAQAQQILDPVMGRTREGVELTEEILKIVSDVDGGVSRPLLHALIRYVNGDKIADWIGLPREPFWDPVVRDGFPRFVALREKLIPLPLVPRIAWTIDEVLRKATLVFLGSGRPISIEMPTANRP